MTRRTTSISSFRSIRAASLLLLAFVVALPGFAASAPGTLVLEGGTIHPVVGTPYTGNVVIQDGLIHAAGADVTAPDGATRVDISGLHVYPGLCDAISQLGLVEIGAVAATVDTTESGMMNPHLVAATAIHPASEVIPVARAGGITHTVTAPETGRDGIIAGRASFIHLDGWTVEEMAIVPSVALVISWPEIETRSFDFSTFSFRDTPFGEAKEEAEASQNTLRDWMDAARHYAQAIAAGSDRLERDHKLEALGPVLSGELPVIIGANAARDIEAAVAFAEEQGIRMILAGGGEAWKVHELLVEKKIPVILGMTATLPDREDAPYDQPFQTAGKLAAAGVPIAIGTGAGGGFGPGGPHSSRTLPFEIGMATAYGLSEEDALAALTINPARMFGLGDRLGSIEAGKIANLIVTDGSPLEITTQIRHVIIGGRDVPLDNKHQELYERYRARPAP